MRLFRAHGLRALPLLVLPSAPAFAQSYSENMHIGEYIVGLAALALVIWDLARRFTKHSAQANHETAPAWAAVSRKPRDFGVWKRLGEVLLDYPFESSLLLILFLMLTLTRVPFSLSAVFVGALTYISLVLGARMASPRPARPAVQPVAAKPAAPPAAVAEPATPPAEEAEPTPQPTATIEPAAPPVTADQPAEPRPADAAPAPSEAEQPVVAARAEAAPAPEAAKTEPTPAAKAPAPRRRTSGSGNGVARPSRGRSTKPKTT